MKSKYETHIKPNFDAIRKMYESGVTLKNIAKAVGVSPSTFHKYQAEHSELGELLKEGKAILDIDLLKLAEEGIKAKLQPRWVEVERIKNSQGQVLTSKWKYIEPTDTILIFTSKSLDPEKWNRAENEIIKARKEKVEAETERIKQGADTGLDVIARLAGYTPNA